MTLRCAILPAALLGAITAVLPAAGAAAAAAAAAPATSSECLKVQTLTFSAAQAAAARRYWTPARIGATRGFSQQAVSRLGKPPSPKSAQSATATQCVPEAAVRNSVAAIAPLRATSPVPSARPATTASGGYPTVGKLTYNADGVLSLNCTATVIDGTPAANHEDLIVTAAHCIEGVTDGIPYTSTDLAFSPMWHNNQAPFGTWTVHKVFLNSWMTCTIPLVDCRTNPANDYAVIVLNPKNGKGVGDVTGANGWSVNQPGTLSNVTLAGIPGTSSNTLTSVSNTVTVTESGTAYREATTPGFTAGTSGGPWFENFSATTGRGTLIGDIGGYEEGGPSSGSPSYSDYWNRQFSAVVSQAVSYEG